MRHIRILFALLTLAGMMGIASPAVGARLASPSQSATIVFLRWERELSPRFLGQHWETGAPDLDAVLAGFVLDQVRPAIRQKLASDPVGLKHILRLKLENSADRPTLLTKLQALSGTIYAEPQPQWHISDDSGESTLPEIGEVPGDPLYGEQYFYPLMQATAAWDLTHSDASVVVAVVDNGTDWNHPDLEANIWTNGGETSGDGIDNDQNGFVDDIRGWDFYDWDNNPEPDDTSAALYFHGTHTAGLVAALINNGRGVVGMAPSCQLMPVKAGYGETISYGFEGVVYAAHNGADVISLSWGGSWPSSYARDVVMDAQAQGCLIVAAAGNEGSAAPHYPAASAGVLAVAATDPDDAKADFSNYGSWISVCAPGLAILSLFPDAYGTVSGTSMSAPLVAGVAALVKSYHPTWTSEKIFAQILYTADNISMKNPQYHGQLGSGRVNAYRALTETAPGLQLEGLIVTETSGNFNGMLDPGESASVIISLKNEGSPTTDVQVVCSYPGWDIQIQQAVWTISQVASGATVTNAGNPFQISVSPGAPTDKSDTLIFTFTSENFYEAPLTSVVWISPAFADHDAGNVVLTLTNFGAFGYQNYVDPYSPYRGSGFRFPADSSNALYHGSLMAGVSPAKISDCADYSKSAFYYGRRYDWQAIENGDFGVFPGAVADQEGTAIYRDSGAPLPEQVGLVVNQHSYAWSSAPNNDFVILSFYLRNRSAGPLDALYVGLFMDWDLIYTSDNEAAWDQSAGGGLGYVYNEMTRDPNQRYYGTCLLSGTLKSYRVIDVFTDIPSSGMTDAMKYEFMSAGMVKTSSSQPSDQATLLSAGPYALGLDDSVQVVFAVLGGEDLADLQANAEAAQAAWSGVAGSPNPAPPAARAFEIENVFPRPANANMNVHFSLPGAGEVAFSLVDLLGRSTSIWKGYYAEGGSYRQSIERRDLASGVYWLRGTTPYGIAAIKIIWLK